MAHVEVESFVRKFRVLWNAGYNASLKLESNLGELSVNLNCSFGRSTPPPSSPLVVTGNQRKYCKTVSPSQQRRHSKRAAARKESKASMMTTQPVTNSEEESMVDDTAVHDVNVSVLNEPSADAEEAHEVKLNGVQDCQISSMENDVDVDGSCRIVSLKK